MGKHWPITWGGVALLVTVLISAMANLPWFSLWQKEVILSIAGSLSILAIIYGIAMDHQHSQAVAPQQQPYDSLKARMENILSQSPLSKGFSDPTSPIENFRIAIRTQIRKSNIIISKGTFLEWKKETLRVIRDWVKPGLGLGGGWENKFEEGRYGRFGEPNKKYLPTVWFSANPKEAIERAIHPHLEVLNQMLERISPGDLV